MFKKIKNWFFKLFLNDKKYIAKTSQGCIEFYIKDNMYFVYNKCLEGNETAFATLIFQLNSGLLSQYLIATLKEDVTHEQYQKILSETKVLTENFIKNSIDNILSGNNESSYVLASEAFKYDTITPTQE